MVNEERYIYRWSPAPAGGGFVSEHQRKNQPDIGERSDGKSVGFDIEKRGRRGWLESEKKKSEDEEGGNEDEGEGGRVRVMVVFRVARQGGESEGNDSNHPNL